MAQTNIGGADVNACESSLDANWNERKHLIDDEFALRLEIQELLVRSDARFEEVRGRERLCQEALRTNQETYEAIVTQWGAEVVRGKSAGLATSVDGNHSS